MSFGEIFNVLVSCFECVCHQNSEGPVVRCVTRCNIEVGWWVTGCGWQIVYIMVFLYLLTVV